MNPNDITKSLLALWEKIGPTGIFLLVVMASVGWAFGTAPELFINDPQVILGALVAALLILMDWRIRECDRRCKGIISDLRNGDDLHMLLHAAKDERLLAELTADNPALTVADALAEIKKICLEVEADFKMRDYTRRPDNIVQQGRAPRAD